MGTKRRVQKNANDQYTITIPKTLIEVLEIKKGEPFEFILSKDGGLILRRARGDRK